MISFLLTSSAISSTICLLNLTLLQLPTRTTVQGKVQLVVLLLLDKLIRVLPPIMSSLHNHRLIQIRTPKYPKCRLSQRHLPKIHHNKVHNPLKVLIPQLLHRPPKVHNQAQARNPLSNTLSNRVKTLLLLQTVLLIMILRSRITNLLLELKMMLATKQIKILLSKCLIVHNQIQMNLLHRFLITPALKINQIPMRLLNRRLITLLLKTKVVQLMLLLLNPKLKKQLLTVRIKAK